MALFRILLNAFETCKMSVLGLDQSIGRRPIYALYVLTDNI